MPTLVNAETTERDALLDFLDAQRGGLRRAVHGLSAEQASSTPSASALSLAGLIKHNARVERGWICLLLGIEDPAGDRSQDWEGEFVLRGEETLEHWLDEYAVVAAETERVIRDLPDLEVTFALPEAPWFPPNATRTARWLLLHLIEEAGRHCGHADIIRETIDGAGAFDLVAAVQSDAAQSDAVQSDAVQSDDAQLAVAG